MLIVATTLLYAGVKLIDLVKKTNPIISDVKIPESMRVEDYMNFNDTNFRFAFTFR